MVFERSNHPIGGAQLRFRFPQLRKYKYLSTCVEAVRRAIPIIASASQAIHRLRRRCGVRVAFAPVRKRFVFVVGKTARKTSSALIPRSAMHIVECATWRRA